MKKLNANDRIKAGMKRREQLLLSAARQANKAGKGLDTFGLSMPGWNALDRLQKKGWLKFKFPYTGKAGYWIVKNKKK